MRIQYRIRRWWFRSNVVRWVRSWLQSRSLLRQMYMTAFSRGIWNADLCMTYASRRDGLLCAGVEASERRGVSGSRDVCPYCHIDYEIRKTFPWHAPVRLQR